MRAGLCWEFTVSEYKYSGNLCLNIKEFGKHDVMIMNFWCFRRKLSWEVGDVETAGFKPFLRIMYGSYYNVG